MVFCNPKKSDTVTKTCNSHNPYFNRWFSAMLSPLSIPTVATGVTILILIDGFLQFTEESDFLITHEESQSLF